MTAQLLDTLRFAAVCAGQDYNRHLFRQAADRIHELEAERHELLALLTQCGLSAAADIALSRVADR